jgi:hypothetical protein
MPWPPYLEQASVIATAGFVAIHGAGAGCEVVDVVVGASYLACCASAHWTRPDL